MKIFNWNEEKNKKLKQERKISFEDVVAAIQTDNLLDIIRNNNNYPHQKVFVIHFNNYVYLVPFIENKTEYFLKTIVPNRKATKQYLN